MKTLVVNLYGGPGTGKSTMMAHVFALLKWEGIRCEMAPEFAKEKVWEGSTDILQNQIYVFGKQLHTIKRLLGKVEVIITDSPLLLSLYYGKNESQAFRNLVVDEKSKLHRLNIFLEREKEYDPIGRLQTEQEAREIDTHVLGLLKEEVYSTAIACPQSAPSIVHEIVGALRTVNPPESIW